MSKVRFFPRSFGQGGAVFAWNASRWSFYLALAGAVHGLALMSRGCAHRSRAPLASNVESPLEVLELGLLEDSPKPMPGPASGGGSIERRSGPRLSAPEQQVKPLAPARQLVPRTPERESLVQAGPHPHDSPLPDDSLLPDPFADDLLTGVESEAHEAVPPHSARRQLLAVSPQPRPPGDPDAAEQVARSSMFEGTGYGTHGGPGGLGHGRGGGARVVTKQFAFGGPAGAFRADVCFIEPSVRLLNDITTCTPVMTFFTNALNVAPRRFDRGFPGLGTRTEWFAIKYRGKFKVSSEDSYTFRLLSDDGARLEIDGHQVLDNDGQHLPIAVSSNVRLDRGLHEFFVLYYQGPPDFVALQLFVRRFAHDEQLFGPVI